MILGSRAVDCALDGLKAAYSWRQPKPFGHLLVHRPKSRLLKRGKCRGKGAKKMITLKAAALSYVQPQMIAAALRAYIKNDTDSYFALVSYHLVVLDQGLLHHGANREQIITVNTC